MEPVEHAEEEPLDKEEAGVPRPEGVFEVVPGREAVLEELGVLEVLGVTEGEAPLDSEAVGEADAVPLAVPVPELVGVTVPVLVGDCVADTLGLWDELGVMEGDAPLVNEEVGEKLTVDEPYKVEEVVGVGVAVADEVGVGVDSADTDPVPEVLGLEDTEGVFEGDAPFVKLGVGEELTVLLPLKVVEGVIDAVPVPVELGVPVLLEVAVPVEERLLVVEGLPDTLELAPFVSEEVGEEDNVELAERVVEGVIDAVLVPELVGVTVEEEEGVCVPEELEVRELLPVFDADSPFEIEAVGDTVIVLLPLKVEEGVMEGELVLLDVGVPLEVGE